MVNKEKQIVIREKAEHLFKLERSLKAMSLMDNTGKSFDELKEQRVEYELHKAKVFEAEQELLKVQKL